jgi:hypothetical protein
VAIDGECFGAADSRRAIADCWGDLRMLILRCQRCRENYKSEERYIGSFIRAVSQDDFDKPERIVRIMFEDKVFILD